MRNTIGVGMFVGLCPLLAIACSDGSGDGGSSSGAGGGGSSCDPKALTCGQIISTGDISTILGEAPEEYDEAGHPNCNIKLAGTTGGGVQVFCGKDYDSMLGGAHASYPDTTEPNTTGQKSFELDISGLAEVGFLTTSGKYAVLVNLITTAANIEDARALATKVDQNLSTL